MKILKTLQQTSSFCLIFYPVGFLELNDKKMTAFKISWECDSIYLSKAFFDSYL